MSPEPVEGSKAIPDVSDMGVPGLGPGEETQCCGVGWQRRGDRTAQMLPRSQTPVKRGRPEGDRVPQSQLDLVKRKLNF